MGRVTTIFESLNALDGEPDSRELRAAIESELAT
jgi:hypothetical protein